MGPLIWDEDHLRPVRDEERARLQVSDLVELERQAFEIDGEFGGIIFGFYTDLPVDGEMSRTVEVMTFFPDGMSGKLTYPLKLPGDPGAV